MRESQEWCRLEPGLHCRGRAETEQQIIVLFSVGLGCSICSRSGQGSQALRYIVPVILDLGSDLSTGIRNDRGAPLTALLMKGRQWKSANQTSWLLELQIILVSLPGQTHFPDTGISCRVAPKRTLMSVSADLEPAL